MSTMSMLEPSRSHDALGDIENDLKLPALVNIEEDEDEDNMSPGTGRAGGEGRDSRATDMGNSP